MTALRRALRRFCQSEEGGATIEFVLLFPFFMSLFLATFEMGMIMARQMMLDRGLDIAVREVRLGLLNPVTHDTLKARICASTMLIPNCAREVRLEMRSADPRRWSTPGTAANGADCVDRADRSAPVVAFTAGRPNELMMLRACALIDPYFPTWGMGQRLAGEDGVIELTSTTAFVIEPS